MKKRGFSCSSLILLAGLTLFAISRSFVGDGPTFTTPSEVDEWSMMDGSSLALNELVKESLADKRTFKHLKTRKFLQDDGTLIVSTEFTAENGFGGTVKGLAKARCDERGRVLDLIEIR